VHFISSGPLRRPTLDYTAYYPLYNTESLISLGDFKLHPLIHTLLESNLRQDMVANRSQSASREISSLKLQGKWQTNPTYDRVELMPRDDMQEKTPVFEGFLAIIPLPPF